MKTLSSCFAIVAAILLCQPASAQQVEATVLNLPNGMKFILVPRHDQPNTISAGWVAKVGSVNERPGITGISHFFEHMMFKGTGTIGTGNPALDAKFRDEQRDLRNAMNAITWGEQYRRYRAGEIEDPWSAANDTPKLAELRASLKSSMDTQQGRGSSPELEAARSALAAIDAASDTGKTRAEEIKARIAKIETELKTRGSIIKDEFDTIYTKGGASQMNAFTSEDVTFYIISIPSNKFELWSWMESNRLSDSVFREFFSERDVVHEERRLRTESTPTGVFQEQFDAMFWESCGYSWPVIGWTSDLNSYTMEEALKYWNIYYRANNLTGVVVGDFDLATVVPLIKRYFGRLQRGTMDPPPVVTLEMKQLAEMRMNAEAECQPQVEVRYHTVPFGHNDSYALEVMSELLNGRTGRLYKGLVEGRSIASGASTQNDTRKYAGAFAFSADVKGDATPGQLEQAWYEELARIQDEPITEREMQRVKNQFAADSYRRLEGNFMLMIQLGYAEALTGWEEINEGPKKFAAVTADDVKRVAKQYFNASNRSVATFTRKGAAGGVAGTNDAAGASDGASSPGGSLDAELAQIPAEMQGMARQVAVQISKIPTAEKAAQAMEKLQTDSQSAPPEAKPLLEFMLRRVQQRIDELNSQGAAGGPATK